MVRYVYFFGISLCEMVDDMSKYLVVWFGLPQSVYDANGYTKDNARYLIIGTVNKARYHVPVVGHPAMFQISNTFTDKSKTVMFWVHIHL